MNIKIYFNNKFMLFEPLETQNPINQHLKTYSNFNTADLKKIIFEFIESDSQESIKIIIDQPEKVTDFLKPFFYYIEAAGGCIEKDQNFLFIHRFGRWDLPKGKLEKKETIEYAAIRECEEECAIKELEIVRQLSSTFHIYAYKDGYALKQTFWFLMRTGYAGELSPQLEENIDEVKWFDRTAIKQQILKDTYHTITDVIMEAIEF